MIASPRIAYLLATAKRYAEGILIRCGINKYKAYEWGNTRKGYWRIADSPILKRAIDNNKLRSAGYATLMEAYLEWYPK